MKTRKVSIATQFFLFILGTAFIASLIVGSISYATMGDFLRKDTTSNVVEIAQIAAENVDGETFSKAVAGDEDALQTVKDSLSFFLVGESVTYVYTLMPKDADHFQFVVDTDPDDPGLYGDDYEADEAMFQAMKGEPSGTEEPITDEWGTFSSGFAPISYNGEILGIVAVDYEASAIQTALNSLLRYILIAVAVGIVLAALTAILALFRIRRNFIKVNNKIVEVASDDGDLTKVLEITSGDELEVIGNSLNQLLNKTGNTVREVKEGTGSIESRMDDINTHVSGSVSQITNINEAMQSMVASSEEIAASIETAGDQVNFVYKDIQNIVDIVTRNTEYLREMNLSSAELNDTAKRSSARILENAETMAQNLQREKEGAEGVLQIRDLSDSILEISGQTNMLALNASIEAARAGESGKGFAVVAEQIGVLADSANEAANKIQDMSDDVVRAIEGLNRLSEQMLSVLRDEVSVDYENFGNVSQSFADKSDSIQESMEQLQQITEQYAESLENIKESMVAVNDASEENSTEIVSVSEMLSSMDSDMKNIGTSIEETFSAISDMTTHLDRYQI